MADGVRVAVAGGTVRVMGAMDTGSGAGATKYSGTQVLKGNDRLIPPAASCAPLRAGVHSRDEGPGVWNIYIYYEYEEQRQRVYPAHLHPHPSTCWAPCASPDPLIPVPCPLIP